MNTFLKTIKKTLLVSMTILLVLAIFLRLRYGGGREYTDISTDSVYKKSDLELVYSHPEPIGNIAATNDSTIRTRLFFTIHPESRPGINKLMEIIDSKAVPYPNAAAQNNMFTTVLGLFVDNQNRLWTIDHGNHGFADVKLTAFDLATDKVVHEYVFPGEVAEKLSFFNDLSVTPDGRYVFVSDVSFFAKKPSLVVYDIKAGKSRSLLDGHPSVAHEKYVPVTPAKKMRFFGIVDLLIGIDGLDLSRDGKYVYYAPMGHSELFRIPVADCIDFSKSDKAIMAKVELVSKKPLSDGIRTDYSGNIYITDIENQGVYVVEPSGKKYTLIKDERIRWADGLSLAGDGYMYLADSDIPNQMLQSKRHIKANGPYHIYRFKSL